MLAATYTPGCFEEFVDGLACENREIGSGDEHEFARGQALRPRTQAF